MKQHSFKSIVSLTVLGCLAIGGGMQADCSGVELLMNGDFEGLQLDEFGDPALDLFGNQQAAAWFRSVGTSADSPPRTQLEDDDSDGVGVRSAKLNYVQDTPTQFGRPADFRSVAFSLPPESTVDLSFDFKYLGVDDTVPDTFWAILRAFTDVDEGGSTAGTFLDQVILQFFTDDPLYPADVWHSASTSFDVPAGGLYGDVIFSINTFGPDILLQGSVLVDNVSVQAEGPVGDYNNDGAVNLADYTEWRDTLGASVEVGDGADGSGNGVIDTADYETWKQNFGMSIFAPVGAEVALNASVTSTQAVPEPSTFALALCLTIAALGRCKTRAC